jgi:NAD-dependent SIR2 family protein deacetylase
VQKTVFVLGAGASAESGAPLMSTFLDRARDLLVADAKADFESVFDALVRLRDVFYKSGLDLDNIESVFGAFEIARIIGKLGHYSVEQIDGLGKSIRMLIVRTLDESIKYEYNDRNRTTGPTPGYSGFMNLMKTMNPKGAYGSACSLLTFNYDIALDYALTHANIPHDYCLEPPTDRNTLRVLKLHGSLNWGKCANCGRVTAQHLSMENVLAVAASSSVSSFTLPGATVIAQGKCGNCSGNLSSEPVIVPPTWNKTEGHNELTAIWKQAAVELGQAENIVCIGYSLPESDLFFRYLFALGTVGEAHISNRGNPPALPGDSQSLTDTGVVLGPDELETG